MTITYEGRLCKQCGTTKRYASTRACYRCHRTYGDERRRQPRTILRQSYNMAKLRAKQKGLEFTLVYDELVIPETCPVLGIPMHVPSIDRNDHAKGYTPDNVTIMSWDANRLKNDGTLEQFKKLVAYLEQATWT